VYRPLIFFVDQYLGKKDFRTIANEDTMNSPKDMTASRTAERKLAGLLSVLPALLNDVKLGSAMAIAWAPSPSRDDVRNS
jgi:hypothetical protein